MPRHLSRISLALSLALLLSASLAFAQDDHRLKTLAKTHGVNYEFADLKSHPGYVSSAQLSFTAQAVVLLGSQEIPVTLESAPEAREKGSTCTGPCNTQSVTWRPEDGPGHNYLSCTRNEGEAFCDIRILRFAQFGRTEAPVPFDWLVVMVDGEELLGGKMHTTVDQNGLLIYPASAELGGHMVVTVKLDGQNEPIRLLSRKEPIFRGKIPGWPPFGAEFQLANPPIEYYRAEEIDNPNAAPFMKVTANTVRLGYERSEFFATKPEIRTIERVKSGGLRVTWTDTASELTSTRIARYHLYRNLKPGKLDTWQRIATLPAGTTVYVDQEAPTDAPVEYVVSHAIDYPFGYEYEGIFNPPVTPERGRMKPLTPDHEQHQH